MKNRKVPALLSVLAVIVTGIIVFGAAYYFLTIMNGGENAYIPIENITGINSKATLKPGIKIKSATRFPENGDMIWCHCGRMEIVSDALALYYIDGIVPSNAAAENPGLPVSNIRIIDVYGDNCTIVFNCTDDNNTYGIFDYPLENLDYNELAVKSADDGIKADIRGSRFTLESGIYLERYQRIIIAVIISVISVGGISLLLRAGKKRGDIFEE